MAVFQVCHAGLKLRGNVRALVEVQAVHLLNGVVYSRDEGGVGNSILGGAMVATIIAVVAAFAVCVVSVAAAVGGRRLHREVGEIVSLAVLASDTHLAKSDGSVASVDRKDSIGLGGPKRLNKLTPQNTLQLTQVVLVVLHTQRHSLVVPPRRGQFRTAIAEVWHAHRHRVVIMTSTMIASSVGSVVAVCASVVVSVVIVVSGRSDGGVDG